MLTKEQKEQLDIIKKRIISGEAVQYAEIYKVAGLKGSDISMSAYNYYITKDGLVPWYKVPGIEKVKIF